ncbi:lytic transglycosylase domain-containing protein [Amycolatopsis sp. NBC_01307]|uniref:lytic transglycosylase domain-containing protein n=1 Tax=Amycolatopsis sp. NBC_01307 TaxID=2903561 RepID=UPI002E1064D9|nr:lytic transglycosylase domain-containing protein [Amycolatopsis sp. NBC_01307]
MSTPVKRYITREPVVPGRTTVFGYRRPLALAGVSVSIAALVASLALGSARDTVLSTAAQDEPAPAGTPALPVLPVVPVLPQQNAIPVVPPIAALPDGSLQPVVPALASAGIPAVALQAYQRAAALLAGADPGCGLSWTVLAAIGRVETNHGRFGGSALRADGETTVPIRGPQLTGSPFALVRDTDRGALDGDPVYDRAVGPMQFLPGTWRSLKADGNLDGRSDPDNVFDAALAAGLYLCSGPGDLRDDAQLRTAILRYNHSDDYADTVLALAKSYGSGYVTAADGPVPPVPAAAAARPGTGAGGAAGVPAPAPAGTVSGPGAFIPDSGTPEPAATVPGSGPGSPVVPPPASTSTPPVTTPPAETTTAPTSPPPAPAETTSTPQPLLSLSLLGVTVKVP